MHTDPITLFVVSECCPVGCGVEVVLLRSTDDDTLFCYCASCGCGWRKPIDTQFAAGLNSVDSPETFASRGIGLPSVVQVQAAGLVQAVLRTMPVTEWVTSASELNADMARRLAVRST